VDVARSETLGIGVVSNLPPPISPRLVCQRATLVYGNATVGTSEAPLLLLDALYHHHHHLGALLTMAR